MWTTETRGERIERLAWAHGDHRERCSAEGHLICQRGQECACMDGSDWADYPAGRVIVRTVAGRTLCQFCRHQERY